MQPPQPNPQATRAGHRMVNASCARNPAASTRFQPNSLRRCASRKLIKLALRHERASRREEFVFAAAQARPAYQKPAGGAARGRRGRPVKHLSVAVEPRFPRIDGSEHLLPTSLMKWRAPWPTCGAIPSWTKQLQAKGSLRQRVAAPKGLDDHMRVCQSRRKRPRRIADDR